MLTKFYLPVWFQRWYVFMVHVFIGCHYIRSVDAAFQKIIIISIANSVFLSLAAAAYKASNLPRPYSVFSYFPKYISNSYKYLNFDTQQDQNLKPEWIGFFFMYWYIRLLPMNLHMCSSVEWEYTGYITSWKSSSKWWFPCNMTLRTVSGTKVGSEDYQLTRNVVNCNTFIPHKASKTYWNSSLTCVGLTDITVVKIWESAYLKLVLHVVKNM